MFPLKKPFRFSRGLRDNLPVFKVNGYLRAYALAPVGETITRAQLLQAIEESKTHRGDIPPHMYYNRFVQGYYKSGGSSLDQCIRLWYCHRKQIYESHGQRLGPILAKILGQ